MTIRNTKYGIRNTLQSIAHVDADAFFASVLQRKNPQLLGKPLLALGMGGGCVIAASYEAKAFGVKTGMSLKEARLLVPHAISIPADFREACLASEELEMILKAECAVVEQYSVDEWFADIASRQGGLPSDLYAWAQAMQQRMQLRTSLTVSVGIASSRLLAKMASEYHKPAGIMVVKSSDIESFLKDRTAAAIPGIGRKRTVHADAHQWKTAWEIANADAEMIVKLFGRPGRDIQRELLGECLVPVTKDIVPPKSISRARSFRPTHDGSMVWAQLLQHMQYLILRMRRHGLECTIVSLWLRDDQYFMDGKALKLPRAGNTEEFIAPYVRACFQRVYQKKQRYTQVGLALHGLIPTAARQQSLFEDIMHAKEGDELQDALDQIRSTHGRSAIQRGAAMQASYDDTPAPPIPLYGM